MLPFGTLIQIDRANKQPLFMQIVNAVIRQVQTGNLPPGTQLPGTRQLAVLLQVHRKTVVTAYDELYAQGWLECQPSKGTYVSTQLPTVDKKVLKPAKQYGSINRASFLINDLPELDQPLYKDANQLQIDDGIPDVRLAPTEELARTYRSVLKTASSKQLLNYGELHGHPVLRRELATYLNSTRGLSITDENIMITRGSQMGIFLCAQLLLKNGQAVAVGNTNYIATDITFQHAGASLLRIEVDEHGLNTKALEQVCAKNRPKAVYVTPHHHHPTTVTLSAERRLHLLELARKYGFAIIEDDYDFDFHYGRGPILPLASADQQGHVLYIGSLCKLIAPALRVGYLVAPKNVIHKAAMLRRIIDRQGDHILELALARMFKEDAIQHHTRKVLKVYKERRDLFVQLIDNIGSQKIQFNIPKGGMALWAQFNQRYPLPDVAKRAAQKGVIMADGTRYDSMGKGLNALRMGFASINRQEATQITQVLKSVLDEMAGKKTI